MIASHNFITTILFNKLKQEEIKAKGFSGLLKVADNVYNAGDNAWAKKIYLKAEHTIKTVPDRYDICQYLEIAHKVFKNFNDTK